MAQLIKFKENATKANARTAGAAAIVVAAVMIVQSILQAIISVFSNLVYSSADGNGYYDAQTSFAPLVGSLFSFGTSVLPITIGVFLAFWPVVPLTPALRVIQVVLRSLIASAIASAVSLVITVFVSIVNGIASAGPIFGNSFPRTDASSFFFSFVGGLQSVFYTFVNVTPLVVLAGFLAWLWASKGRPAASAL